MMSETPNLHMGLLVPGQSLREQTINAMFQVVDAAVGSRINGGARNDPPSTASVGAAYLVGPAPTGDWTGKTDCVAVRGEGGWLYLEPRHGQTLWDEASGRAWVYMGQEWIDGRGVFADIHVDGVQVLGSQSAAIDDPSGGPTIDSEARTAIGAILDALRGHGLIAS